MTEVIEKIIIILQSLSDPNISAEMIENLYTATTIASSIEKI